MAEVQLAMASEAPPMRKCTDAAFFVIFVTCCIAVIPFGIAFSAGGDINRFWYGCDRRGDVCGVKNAPIKGVNCSGQDMTERPIALLRYYPTNGCRRFSEGIILPGCCVDQCPPPHQLIFNRCFPPENAILEVNSKYQKYMLEILHAIHQSSSTILVSCLTGLVFALTMLVCLRWNQARLIFWTMIGLELVVSTVTLTILWHTYLSTETKTFLHLLAMLMIMVYIFFLILFVILLHGTFKFPIQIYEEAIKAIFTMPKILMHSLLSLVAVIASAALMVFLMILVLTNQSLKKTVDPFTLAYSTNIYTVVLAVYIVLMIVWIYAFAEGWQSMITAGAVGQYFRTRDKSSLLRPVEISGHNALNYHLGTVALGSLLVTCFTFTRDMINYMIRKLCALTAIRGKSFSKSSADVVQIFGYNWIHTLSLAGFHYIVTSGFCCILMLLTIGLGCWINLEQSDRYYSLTGVILGVVAAQIIASFVFQIVAVDTIYFCYCEEQQRSGRGDGDASSRAYKNQARTVNKSFSVEAN